MTCIRPTFIAIALSLSCATPLLFAQNPPTVHAENFSSKTHTAKFTLKRLDDPLRAGETTDTYMARNQFPLERFSLLEKLGKIEMDAYDSLDEVATPGVVLPSQDEYTKRLYEMSRLAKDFCKGNPCKKSDDSALLALNRRDLIIFICDVVHTRIIAEQNNAVDATWPANVSKLRDAVHILISRYPSPPTSF